MTEKFISIKEALSQAKQGKEVSIRGWVYRKRELKEKIFLVIRDVSGIIQTVVKATDKKIFSVAQKVTIESSVILSGIIHKDKRAPGGFELSLKKLEIIGLADTFPISKDKSEEFLMDKRHLWLRSRKLTAALKVRSAVFGAIHEYFRSKGFYEVQSPSFTPVACEGGSTLFEVKYFDKKVYLTQSWQLYAEAVLPSLEKIYCIAPSFRAEKSRTTHHLTEYWHAEMEVAWTGMDECIHYGEEMISHICKRVAIDCIDDLKFLGRDPKDLLKIKPPFPKIKYRKALKILQKDGVKIGWGKDIRTIEGKQLMKHYDKPLFITHYPKEIMAFYKPRDPTQPNEVLGFDCFAPEYGFELIGGSERDTDIEALKESLKKEGEDPNKYEWYFDTRRFGLVQHSGYGFGIERCVQWLCKLEHIRDTIPFPRTVNRIYP